MLLRIITLYSVYLVSAKKLKCLEALHGASSYFSSLQDESRSLFNGCKNQSKEIHVLFVISKP